MLSLQDNTILGQVGPGTMMGDLLRRFWVPFIEASWVEPVAGDPVEVELLGEKLIVFTDGEGRYVHVRELLPSPRHPALLREERRRRPPLHLPRLEVRQHRRVYGDAVRTRPLQLQEQDIGEVLPRPRDGWDPLGLHGPAGDHAGPAPHRMGWRHPGDAEHRQVQPRSATGCRRWRATSTPATSASFTGGRSSVDASISRQGQRPSPLRHLAPLGRRDDRLRHDARRTAHDQRPRPRLLAHQPVAHALRPP